MVRDIRFSVIVLMFMQVLISSTAPAAPQIQYRVEAEDGAALALSEPQLPDISGYNENAVNERVKHAREAASRGAVVQVRRIFGEVTMDDFTIGERAREWAARQYSNPQAIFLKSGFFTMAQLWQQLDRREYLERLADGTYIARLPVVVEAGATLLMDAGESLYLSQQRGSFLVVSGTLITRSAKVVGWNEQLKAPARYQRASQFRPFLVSWGGSELYLLNSEFISLGYEQSKSYGITVSQYRHEINRTLKQPSPKAWIIGSTFEDIYYGFYCYETVGAVVLNNRYVDNIVYGIDPHDRSSELIIGHNEVYGTHKKHGIIVSREVNDSWIFNNVSHHNQLSGFVLDRSSVGNVVANNVAHHNLSDGITLYESSDNLLWANRVYANDKHGIRMRNSKNIRLYHNNVAGNKGFGVYGDVQDLSDTDRDNHMDPYEARVSMILYGGSLVANERGPFSMEQPEFMKIFNVDIRFGSEPLNPNNDGIFARFHSEILDILLRQKQAVSVTPIPQENS
ncbi:NosD domain-containing protein [Gynuella sunshinyii]|uniref:Carbohydrate-binding/sugar hydrolysis domain-containing protein n=1 Tax=Gynuella sunshinyii YC6258 TaxID=1445510 RepID=A0A0C5VI17_9GAMM|nr:right-handed parallel beta-helix repeat-containing protein [Gynuella sunshinyii]AJQ93018.1 hypothetical Protein YC6258_00968 [Gynuella sunshinyii YC6258]